MRPYLVLIRPDYLDGTTAVGFVVRGWCGGRVGVTKWGGGGESRTRQVRPTVGPTVLLGAVDQTKRSVDLRPPFRFTLWTRVLQTCPLATRARSLGRFW